MCRRIWACVSRIICGFEAQIGVSVGAEIVRDKWVGPVAPADAGPVRRSTTTLAPMPSRNPFVTICGFL
jgi:hypothetical protein